MLCAQFVCVLLCPCTLYVELEPRTLFFLRNQLRCSLLYYRRDTMWNSGLDWV